MLLKDHSFPGDAILEVLIKLPVKTLIRFKCVCKSWSSLISKPHFCLKHLDNYNHNYARLVVGFWIFGVDGRYSLCLFPDETLEDLSYEELTPHMPILEGHVISFQFGIFCLLGCNNQITLWNFNTREYRTLPRCRAVLPRYMRISYIDVKFGLELMSNDYKLVSIGSLWDERGIHPYVYSFVSIYSLATNSWTRIKGNELIPYQIEHQYDGTYLDGVLYWLAYSNRDQQFVLSFHLADEEFHEIERPGEIAASTITYLGLRNSFLSCLVYKEIDGFFEIWVRKELSWSKYLNVGPVLSVHWPLGFWKNNSFFIESRNEELLLFDPNTNNLTFLGLKTYGFSVFMYKESVIGIKDDISIDESEYEIPWHLLGVDLG